MRTRYLRRTLTALISLTTVILTVQLTTSPTALANDGYPNPGDQWAPAFTANPIDNNLYAASDDGSGNGPCSANGGSGEYPHVAYYANNATPVKRALETFTLENSGDWDAKLTVMTQRSHTTEYEITGGLDAEGLASFGVGYTDSTTDTAGAQAEFTVPAHSRLTVHYGDEYKDLIVTDLWKWQGYDPNPIDGGPYSCHIGRFTASAQIQSTPRLFWADAPQPIQ